jgi:hypothetical protein
MADAIITRDRPRGHLRAIQLAGVASMLVGGASSWAQAPLAGSTLPFCPAYPPGTAPAIGPSNCTPIPAALWGHTTPAPDVGAQPAQTAAVAPPAPPPDQSRVARDPAPQAATSLSVAQGERAGAAASQPPPPPNEAHAAKPPGLQAAIFLRTPDAITLAQIAAMLGLAAKRSVTFTLSSADEYKKTDLTHRVRLTWTGSLQALVDQLAEIYGLNVSIDDFAIRFSSRQRDSAGSASTTRTP